MIGKASKFFNLNKVLFRASSQNLELPIIDISSVKGPNSQPDLAQCKELIEGLRKYGALAIRDPNIDESKNLEFLTMMEDYFSSRSKLYYNGETLKEAFPENGYQVGVTPELIESARDNAKAAKLLKDGHRPVTPHPAPKDGKWRFFWRIGEDISEETNNLLPPQVIPEDFPQWEHKMNSWGNLVFFG